jgi:GTP-binding protein
LVDAERAKQQAEVSEADKLPVLTISDEDAWHVKKTDKGFVVTGRKIERFARRTDFDNYHGVQRLRDIMKKMGIMHALVRAQIEAGQKIIIGQPEIGRMEY